MRPIFVILTLLPLADCGKSEIAACNSDEVLKVLTRGAAKGFQGTIDDTFKELLAAPTPGNERAFEKLKTITSKVTNIRQTRYDKQNDTRYCAGEFSYSRDPYAEQPVLKYVLRKNTICEKNFTYKIERTLDKPDSFYVTWRCS